MGQNTGTGSTSLTVSNDTCGSSVAGYRIYRAPAGGSYKLLADIGNTLVYTDTTARDGETYDYKVSAYNAANEESGMSAASQVVVQDTTPAAVPTGLSGIAGDSKADLEWSDNQDTDIYGYNVYMSTTPGGPWNKMNASPIHAWEGGQWTQVGLANGQTYYFTVTSVDMAGNESATSLEVSVTPGP